MLMISRVIKKMTCEIPMRSEVIEGEKWIDNITEMKK